MLTLELRALTFQLHKSTVSGVSEATFPQIFTIVFCSLVTANFLSALHDAASRPWSLILLPQKWSASYMWLC